MMTFGKSVGLRLTAAAVSVFVSTAAMAADYPTRPLTAIVSWPAGGGTDIAARTALKFAEPDLGQQVNVRNIEGGGGAIGYVQGAALPANGYNLMVMQFDILSIAAQKIAPVSYENFDLVGMFADQPMFLFVKGDSRIKDVAGFISAAKDARLKVAGASIGGVNHQASHLMETALGVSYTYVPYKGVTGILPAILAGEADAGTAFITGMTGSVESGDVRLLAVMADQRAKDYPEVPTFKELGYDVQYAGFYGLAAPKGTSPAQVERLEQAIVGACHNGVYQDAAAKLGLNPKCMDATAFQDYLDQMYPVVERISAEILK